MDNQELTQKFQIYEQQIMQVQQQLQAVEQAIVELSKINLGLDELVGKVDEEIKAPIGKGIYVKAKLISEELTVDIGGNNFVQKSIPDTKKIIEEQIIKLKEMKGQFEGDLDQINNELTATMRSAQEEKECCVEGKCGTEECEEDCDCSH